MRSYSFLPNETIERTIFALDSKMPLDPNYFTNKHFFNTLQEFFLSNEEQYDEKICYREKLSSWLKDYKNPKILKPNNKRFVIRDLRNFCNEFDSIKMLFKGIFINNEFYHERILAFHNEHFDPLMANYMSKLSEKLKSDEDIAFLGCSFYCGTLLYMNEKLLENKNLILKLLTINFNYYLVASEKLLKDKEFTIKALETNSKCFTHIAKKFADDREFMAVVQQKYKELLKKKDLIK